MDSATGRVLDIQDFRRRCAAHHQWLTADPDAVEFIEQWAESNLKALWSDQSAVVRSLTVPWRACGRYRDPPTMTDNGRPCRGGYHGQ